MDSLKTFESSGKHYRVGRLDIFDQVHIVRKLMPVIASGLDSKMLENVKSFDDLKEFSISALLRSMAIPFSLAIAHMDKESVEFVLRTCLSVCERREDAGNGNYNWAAVQAANGRMMYNDIELLDVFRIVSEVVRVNLASFFAIAQQDSQDKVQR